MQLELSRLAVADLEGIHFYGILNFGARQADLYLDGLFAEFDALMAHPLSRPERREVRPPVRLSPYQAHHIFYRVVEDKVVILRVLHHNAHWGLLL